MIIAQCCIIKPAIPECLERGESEGTHHADLRPLKGHTGVVYEDNEPFISPNTVYNGLITIKMAEKQA